MKAGADFKQKDTTPPPQPPKPNPKNIANEKKIKELEQQIARLSTERQTWESLLRPPSPEPPLSPLQSAPDPLSISSDLLSSPTQKFTLQTLRTFHCSHTETYNDGTQPSSSSAPSSSSSNLLESTTSRLRNITQNLEFDIDSFAANVHVLANYKDVSERVADEVLRISARALEEREREGRTRRRGAEDGREGDGEEIRMKDVLRGLSRIIDR
ncbi:MAG: hypothetical protein Q9190_005157 [Brigantiaea leucoxantha]